MAFHRGPPAILAQRREKRSRPLRVLLGRMLMYLGRFKRIVAIGATMSLILSVVSILDPLILSRGVDIVFTEHAGLDALLIIVLLYIVLKTGLWIMESVNIWILAGAQAGLVEAIQNDTYEHLIDADLSYHKNEQSGNITSRVTSDTVNLGIGIEVIIDFASQILVLASTLVLMLLTSPLIMLASLVTVPGIVAITVLFGTIGQRIMLATQRTYGEVSGQIAENLSGVHIAKAFNREREVASRLMELNQKLYSYGLRLNVFMSTMQPLMRIIGQFAIAAVLFVGGTLVTGTTPLLTVGQLFLGISLINRFMWPLLSLAMSATQVQASLASMDRVLDVIESKRMITDSKDSVSLSPQDDGIRFDHVTFSYVRGTPVLRDVSFTVRPGETVAIVGHTGAGKTTIAALINRFYDPDEGAIFIGEKDLRKVRLASLHDTVALVSQEPYLFDGTVIENILYGRPDASEQEVLEICRAIGADQFIEVLPEGYNTIVIENGKNLSAGQRQMITIARTMLADPRILILDEATSRLDAYSEALVQEAQSMLFAGRTTVVIAHRLTTIANASRVLVFDHGVLVEEGTHEELLARGGVFKLLYDTYYAHQGIDEITPECVQVAKSVTPESSPRDSAYEHRGIDRGTGGTSHMGP